MTGTEFVNILKSPTSKIIIFGFLLISGALVLIPILNRNDDPDSIQENTELKQEDKVPIEIGSGIPHFKAERENDDKTMSPPPEIISRSSTPETSSNTTPATKNPFFYSTKHLTLPIKIIKNNTTIIKLNTTPHYISNNNNNKNNIPNYNTIQQEHDSPSNFQRSISEKVIKLNKYKTHTKLKKPIYKKKIMNGKYPIFNGNDITKTSPNKKRTINVDDISYELTSKDNLIQGTHKNNSSFQTFTFDFCRRKNYTNNLSINIGIDKDERDNGENSHLLNKNESQIQFMPGLYSVNQSILPGVNTTTNGTNKKTKEREILFSPIKINNGFRSKMYKEVKDKISGGTYLGISYHYNNDNNGKSFLKSKYNISFDFNKVRK